MTECSYNLSDRPFYFVVIVVTLISAAVIIFIAIAAIRRIYKFLASANSHAEIAFQLLVDAMISVQTNEELIAKYIKKDKVKKRRDKKERDSETDMSDDDDY